METMFLTPLSFPLFQIYDEIDRLAANCPSGCTCTTRDIGTTVGGNPLTILDVCSTVLV